jgi:sorting nexin-4
MNDEYETLYQTRGTASTAVSTRHEAEPDFGEQQKGSNPGQAGRLAGNLDLAGVGEAKLECTVTNPLKENDGSKDAYMSYLVTTTVGTLSF